MNLFAYALRRAFKGMGEHPFLAAATISTIATVLLLLGTFGLVISNLSGVMDRWGKDVQISCYLRDDVDDETVFRIRAELSERPEVTSVRYVSRDEALERFADSIDGLDRLLADLDDNPLPASLEIRLDGAFQNPGEVRRIAEQLRRPEFEDLDWSREWVERFHAFLGLLRLSALILGTLLLCAAVILVSTTIRLAIYARRDELEIVGLVGGTRLFVRLPFLLEGALQGLAGALLALGLLVALFRLAFVELQDVLGLLLGKGVLTFLPPSSLGLLVAAGLAVGLVGAWSSLIRAGSDGVAA